MALPLAAACATRTAAPPAGAAFRFPGDTFAFANETVWEYAVEPATGSVRWWKREPRPPWSLRCGTMVRAARQFHEHARFDASAPPLDAAAYAALVRAVLATDPRARPGARVVIPGFPDLRAFSATHEPLLKAAMAGPWQSYVQRGNWRMIFPFPAAHQAREAERLEAVLAAGRAPIVHVLRFPSLTVNHLLVVFAAEATPAEVRFTAYDPNDAGAPVALIWDRVARQFALSTTRYFPGGPVRAYEVYRGWLY